MRPQNLTPIFKKISSINGIGPKLEILFNKLIGHNIVHLLWHLPINFINRVNTNDLNSVKIGTIIISEIKVIEHFPSKFKKQPYRIKCMCNNIELNIVYFNAKNPYIKSILPINEKRIICGKIEFFNNKFQITHPEYILNINDIDKIKNIQPTYSLTKGLTQKVYYKTLLKVLPKIPDLDEWIDNNTLKYFNFPKWKESLIYLHSPRNNNDIVKYNDYRKRLAFDELFSHQLAISIIRNSNIKQKGIKFEKKFDFSNILIQNLPFDLTNSQKHVLKEIKNDLYSNNQMIRLLQGDVGSGKTIISIISMFCSFKSGFQSALMAPTEILSNQHFETMQEIFKKFSINITLLSGKDKGKIRNIKLKKIYNGEANIIIGTHALIQEDVKFKKLGLVIIDEQHRFGVHQRLAFTYKGLKPNILVMTATPIPRTLTLAVYGDMKESKLVEKPKGRVSIKTSSISIKKIHDLINALKRKVQKNEKIFWVCPLIEESEELDLEAAKERYKKLDKIFNNKVLLIHGQLKSKDKEKIMNDFKYNDYNILVATTVIEVGIDIPKASTLIIEHAERFGLAQLHQLRGRVGRSNIKSNCILLYSSNIGKIAKKRIKTIKETNDGFKIAEQDLEIRGPGELLGKKQSGIPNFKIADLSFDKDLLEQARIDTKKILNNNININKGKNLKYLLYLFEQDVAIKTLLSG